MKRISISFLTLVLFANIMIPTIGTGQVIRHPTLGLEQTPTWGSIKIQGISVEEKVNGMLIRMICSEKFLPGQVTAWISESDWFYITLLGARIDTTKKWQFIKTGFILDYQTQQLKESVQLSFRLNREIEAYEIMINPREVIITLRLPIAETVAVIEKYSEIRSKELSPSIKVRDTGFKERIPNVLLLTGTAFVVTGLIEPSGSTFILGSVLIITGYLLKKIDLKNHSPLNHISHKVKH